VSRYPQSTKVIDYLLAKIGDMGGVAVASLNSPPFDDYLSGLNYAARLIKLNHLYDKLVERGLIVNLGGQNFALTEIGKRRLASSRLAASQIPAQSPWDKHWRLLAFRIPKAKMAARQQLRLELRRLGLLSIHPGLWVHPFPFDTIVTELEQVYDIADCLVYFEVLYSDREQPWQTHFEDTLRAAGG
jgi:hypothetical protein